MTKLVALVAVLAISACGVPSASKVVPLSESELPPELSEQTTTTSTTTTVLVTEPVELYYISANRVVATTLTIVSPATTSQVLAALIAGPPTGDNGLGLRSALPTSLSAEIKISKGIAQIDTTAQFLSSLSPIDQRLAIAQLVMTFTRRPGIGQVIFTVDGANVAVPRGRGNLATPGSAVSFDDYSSLLVAPTG